MTRRSPVPLPPLIRYEKMSAYERRFLRGFLLGYFLVAPLVIGLAYALLA